MTNNNEFAITTIDNYNTTTTLQKKSTKRFGVKPEKKPVAKKTKTSPFSCYTDKISDLVTDPTIPTDTENTLNIKKDEDSLTVKTPVDSKSSDYWTIVHYKFDIIANVVPHDRWKHAKGAVKISLLGQHPDDLATSKELITLIQFVFDRLMRHPNKKITRQHKPKKKKKIIKCV
ncbi:Uncharacterized protein FWK35_00020072 [Aphis craccivora]|uniref:Uncharacterized protein n=1 Tax=Aphis craccivora TaxID=307492 RepID=A0A6G0XYF5_APHCR|nr:Uncharacterized protein FWK35_00020072 [Aphis craccivora]